jgi:hypothetical protein
MPIPVSSTNRFLFFSFRLHNNVCSNQFMVSLYNETILNTSILPLLKTLRFSFMKFLQLNNANVASVIKICKTQKISN